MMKAFNNLIGRNYQYRKLKNKWSSLKKRLVVLEYFNYERVWPWVGFYEANHQ